MGNNFIFTSPSNDYFAGRQYFDLGDFYDQLPSRATAAANVTTCEVPEPGAFGPWYPPYAHISGIPENPLKKRSYACSRCIVWPTVTKSGGVYSLGDCYVYHSCSLDRHIDQDDSLPGNYKTETGPLRLVSSGPGQRQFKIRASDSGDIVHGIDCNGAPESDHWLLGTSQWSSIRDSILGNDIARDNVPHTVGLFFRVVRWKYLCHIRTEDTPHEFVFTDEKLALLEGGCFFAEPLTALYS